MIYLVTLNQDLFECDEYKIIGVDESLSLLSKYKILQADSETSGKDPHICTLLLFQLGSPNKELQVVIDCTTIDIRRYKDLLESTYLIFQNGKFDLQFLYNYSIIPRKIYDTMIVEQLLYLGYPKGSISYALNAIAKRRLNQDIDKTVRGEIIWRGIDLKVIQYAANDVVYLYDIMQSQLKDCRERNCLVGAKLECDTVPSIAYLEWCGIKLDENKWKIKMQKDADKLHKAKKALDDFLINLNKKGLDTRKTNTVLSGISFNSDNTPCSFKITKDIYIKPNSFKEFIFINTQGDLFNGFCDEPQCNINWSSSRQVIKIARILGFNTQVQDKKTGEDKDSVIEKHLSSQKGINDEFLKLYFDYQEQAKLVSSFGQSQLNMINPRTGRCHTIYRQLGASSGK